MVTFGQFANDLYSNVRNKTRSKKNRGSGMETVTAVLVTEGITADRS